MTEILGKFVVAKWSDGSFKTAGIVVSFTDRPTVGIKLADGTYINWIADMCEIKDIGAGATQLLLEQFRSRVVGRQPEDPEATP